MGGSLVEVPGRNSGSEDEVLSLPPHPEYYNMAGPPTLEELMEEEDGGLPAAFVWDNARDQETVEERDVESEDSTTDGSYANGSG